MRILKLMTNENGMLFSAEHHPSDFAEHRIHRQHQQCCCSAPDAKATRNLTCDADVVSDDCGPITYRHYYCDDRWSIKCRHSHHVTVNSQPASKRRWF